MKYIFNKIICFFIGHKYKYSVYDNHRRKCKICKQRQNKTKGKWISIKK